MKNRHVAFALTASLGLLASATFAQPGFAQPVPAPMRIRATIEKVSATMLQLKTRDGDNYTVTVTPDLRVTGVSKGTISDIKSGSYIGCAAVPGPDGSLKALEVSVFPPSMKGTGEGSQAWDLGANSTMTNGTVGDLVGSSGRVMTVNYNGSEKKITVPDDAPIVTFAAADRSLLIVGAHVIVAPAKGTDGTLTASRISVGTDGIVPPM